MSLPEDFDWEYYLEVNVDLRLNGINDKRGAKEHYLNFGYNEIRVFKKLTPIKLKNQNIINNDIILVTQYIKLNEHSLYDYIEHAKNGVLKLDYHIVIFTTKEYIDLFMGIRKSYGFGDKTTIVEVTWNDFVLDDMELLKRNCKLSKTIDRHKNPERLRNTHTKPKFVMRAMDMFDSEYFAFIDIAISHVVQLSNDRFILNDKTKIKMGRISSTSIAGGLFIGSRDSFVRLNKVYYELMNSHLNSNKLSGGDFLFNDLYEYQPSLFNVIDINIHDIFNKLIG